jgi:tripartite-type tricarboxylate transporter receptor subunit TctC
MEAVTWFAVVAPKGTPEPVVQKLNQSLVGALNLADVRAQFAEQGAEVVGNRPEQMRQFVREETERWARVISEAHVTVD